MPSVCESFRRSQAALDELVRRTRIPPFAQTSAAPGEARRGRRPGVPRDAATRRKAGARALARPVNVLCSAAQSTRGKAPQRSVRHWLGPRRGPRCRAPTPLGWCWPVLKSMRGLPRGPRGYLFSMPPRPAPATRVSDSRARPPRRRGARNRRRARGDQGRCARRRRRGLRRRRSFRRPPRPRQRLSR